MNQLPQAYLKAKANLNAIQREAVHAIEGPVMVLAGPGTGKTQILSTRIAYMLLEAGLDIQPDNILCLTFTDAGVVSMRKRLQELIGPLSYRISVYTYHAFCNSVIQAHPEQFSSLRSLQQISPIEKRLLVKKLLQSLPPDNPLRRLNESYYNEAKNIEQLHSDLKKENISPEKLIHSIEEYIESLPNNKGFIYQRNGNGYKKGDLKLSKIREEEQKYSRTVAAAKLYHPYEQLKTEQGFYDYEDMIQWVRRAFAEYPDELLLPYQERYQYVLVDEFQDSNGSQTDLLKQLVSYWGDQANVFIVGDDDQAIYRFQGAKLKNFVDFLGKDWFPDARVFSLVENYRSTQAILDAAGSFIAQNQNRLIRLIDEEKLKNHNNPISKDLKADKENLNPSIPPEIRTFQTVFDEMTWVALEVQKRIESGVKPSEIAILYRKHKVIADLERVFAFREIPFQVRTSTDVLTHPIGQEFVRLLSVLARLYHQIQAEEPNSAEYNESLGLLLLQAWWELPSVPLQLSLTQFSKQRKQNPDLQLVEFFFSLTPSALISQLFLDQVRHLLEDIYHWAHRLASETLAQVFARILNRGGLMKWLIAQPKPLEALGVVNRFLGFAEDYSLHRPDTTLPDMIAVLEEMVQEGIELPLNEIENLGKGVVLSTLHSAKGKEFEYVYMIDLTDNNWGKMRNHGLAIPPTLILESKETDEETDEEEGRRLFYVGMTRAKKYLSISWSKIYSFGKERAPHKFLTELIQQAKLKEQIFEPNEDWSGLGLDFEIHSKLWPDERPSELLPEETLRNLLVDYRLSPSDLGEYLHCPRQFYYSRLLRLPTIRDPYLAFGEVVHDALFHFFSEFDHHKLLPSSERFVELFQHQMLRKKGLLSNERYQFYLEYGRTFLPNYYEARKQLWATQVNVQLEKRFEADLDGIPLVGKVDKLVLEQDGFSVTDYKTGKHKKDRLAFPTESPINYGGDYWRQITFYYFLLTHANLKGKYIKGVIDYIQPNDDDTYDLAEVVVTEESQRQLEFFIRFTWESIQKLKFDKVLPIEAEEKCEYCAYKRMCWA